MSYTATKYVSPKPFEYPNGFANEDRTTIIRGALFENDTSTEYSVGGIGSSAFEVTAFSNVGLVTYSNLVGLQLVNGQTVVVYNTSGNTNDGTYIVSQLTPSSATAGTFVAVPIPGKALAGSSQTGQTAEGVGQLSFTERQQINQTFTISGVSASAGITTVTYTTLVGPQLRPGQTVILPVTGGAGTAVYTVTNAFPTSSTAGSFTVQDPSAVATSGSGTGIFITGTDVVQTLDNPIQVTITGAKGYWYQYDYINNTIRIFVTGSANGPAVEAAVGATVAFDGTMRFEAVFIRARQ